MAGNHLATDKTWSFTVAGTTDTTPPTVVSTTPASGATGVSASSNVVATFSEAMNPSSITTSSFTLRQQVVAQIYLQSYHILAHTATLNPSANLAAGTKYTATISTAVTDVAGNHLVADKNMVVYRCWYCRYHAPNGSCQPLQPTEPQVFLLPPTL